MKKRLSLVLAAITVVAVITAMLAIMSVPAAAEDPAAAGADDVVVRIWASDTDDRSTATEAVAGGIKYSALLAAGGLPAYSGSGSVDTDNITAQLAIQGKYIWVEFEPFTIAINACGVNGSQNGLGIYAGVGKKTYVVGNNTVLTEGDMINFRHMMSTATIRSDKNIVSGGEVILQDLTMMALEGDGTRVLRPYTGTTSLVNVQLDSVTENGGTVYFGDGACTLNVDAASTINGVDGVWVQTTAAVTVTGTGGNITGTTGLRIWAGAGNVTLGDGTENSITVAGDNQGVLFVNDNSAAKLTVKSGATVKAAGNVSGKYAINLMSNDTVDVYGTVQSYSHTIYGNSGNNTVNVFAGGVVETLDGSVQDHTQTVNRVGTVNVKGGTIINRVTNQGGTYAVTLEGDTLNLESGIVEGSKNQVLNISGAKSYVNISGGEIRYHGTAAAILVREKAALTEIRLSGTGAIKAPNGTGINSETGVPKIVEISGGSIETKSYAIDTESGDSITVSGGSVTSPVSGVINVVSGARLEIIDGTIACTTASNTINAAGTVIISGGNISTNNGSRIIRLDAGGDVQISGGTFATSAEFYVIQRDHNESTASTLSNVTITGGTFTGGIDIKDNTALSVSNADITGRLLLSTTSTTPVSISGSTVTYGGTATMITCATGAQITFSNTDVSYTNDENISNTTSFGTATVTVDGGSMTVTENGPYLFAGFGGELIVTGGAQLITQNSFVIQLTGSGTATINDGIVSSSRDGLITVGAGCTLNVSGANTSIENTGTSAALVAAGDVVITGGSVGGKIYLSESTGKLSIKNAAVNGQLSLGSGSADQTILIENCNITLGVNDNMINCGKMTVVIDGGTLTSSGGNHVVTTGGTLTIQGGAQLNAGDNTAAVVGYTGSSITITGSGTAITGTNKGAGGTSTGVIEFKGTDLSIGEGVAVSATTGNAIYTSGALSCAGDISTETGHALVVAGTAALTGGSVMAGSNTLDLNNIGGGTVTEFSNVTLTGKLTADQGSLTASAVTVSLDTNKITLSGGGISAISLADGTSLDMTDLTSSVGINLSNGDLTVNGVKNGDTYSVNIGGGVAVNGTSKLNIVGAQINGALYLRNTNSDEMIIKDSKIWIAGNRDENVVNCNNTNAVLTIDNSQIISNTVADMPIVFKGVTLKVTNGSLVESNNIYDNGADGIAINISGTASVVTIDGGSTVRSSRDGAVTVNAGCTLNVSGAATKIINDNKAAAIIAHGNVNINGGEFTGKIYLGSGTGKLSMENATVNGRLELAGASSDQAIMIKNCNIAIMSGDNLINCGAKTVIIDGGTLTSTGGDHVVTTSGTLTIQGGAQLNAGDNTAAVVGYTGSSITITGSGTAITGTSRGAGTAPATGVIEFNGTDLTIGDGVAVSATSGCAVYSTGALSCAGDLSSESGLALYSVGGSVAISGGTTETGETAVENGALTVTGATVSMVAGKLTLEGGSISAISLGGGVDLDMTNTNSSVGIASSGELSINGGALTSSSGYVINTSGRLTVNGGATLTATGSAAVILVDSGADITLVATTLTSDANVIEFRADCADATVELQSVAAARTNDSSKYVILINGGAVRNVVNVNGAELTGCIADASGSTGADKNIINLSSGRLTTVMSAALVFSLAETVGDEFIIDTSSSDPYYIVTISATITLTGEGDSFDISAKLWSLGDKLLVVSVASENGFKLVHTEVPEAQKIEYAILDGNGEAVAAEGGNVISFTGESAKQTASVSINIITDITTVGYSGEWSDTLTFTFNISGSDAASWYGNSQEPSSGFSDPY